MGGSGPVIGKSSDGASRVRAVRIFAKGVIIIKPVTNLNLQRKDCFAPPCACHLAITRGTSCTQQECPSLFVMRRGSSIPLASDQQLEECRTRLPAGIIAARVARVRHSAPDQLDVSHGPALN